jgi:hypothetical protein
VVAPVPPQAQPEAAPAPAPAKREAKTYAALNDLNAHRVDTVLGHLNGPARKALKQNGYNLERIATTRDEDLAAISGISGDSVRAIRQRVPFMDGSDS